MHVILIAVLFNVDGFKLTKKSSNIELKMSVDKFSDTHFNAIPFKTLCSAEVTIDQLEKDIREFEKVYNFPDGMSVFLNIAEHLESFKNRRVSHLHIL